MPVPNHKATVATVRDKYGPMPTANECVELCNEVAWIHRAEGFGVAEKTAGTRGQRHDGQLCAIDGLVYRPPGGGAEQFIDILAGADNATPPRARPAWQEYATSNRKWIAPIAPAGAPPPDPPPNPEPEPGDYVTPAQLQATLAAYDKTVEQRLAGIRDDLEALSDRVTKLESGSGEYELVPDPNAAPIPTSSATLSLSHRHDVRARIQRKPTP